MPVDKVALLDQEARDYVGRKLLELTLKELFVFRFMQVGLSKCETNAIYLSLSSSDPHSLETYENN